jgi:hypothetical protein
MNMDALNCLYNSLLSACSKDLPLIDFNTKNDPFPRRPLQYEVRVIIFPQTWGSTSLGYGGVGGHALTEAYTMIIYFEDHYCVYFGNGKILAYYINAAKISPDGYNNFMKDIRDQNMREVYNRGKYA